MPSWKGADFKAQSRALDRALTSAPTEVEARQAAQRVQAFAEPTRLRLAAIIRTAGEACVSDLVTISGIEQSVVSHHLTRLRNDKLVRVRREGKLALYSLSNEARQLLDALWPRSEKASEQPVGRVTT